VSDMHLCCYEAKPPNLKLKAKPKPVLGHHHSDIVHPITMQVQECAFFKTFLLITVRKVIIELAADASNS
jgi:hypothetical protein